MVSNLEACEKEHDSSLEKAPSSDRKIRVVATRSDDTGNLELGKKDSSKTASTCTESQSALQGEDEAASRLKKPDTQQQNSSRKIRIVLQRKQLDELLIAYNGSRDEADIPFTAIRPTMSETDRIGLRRDDKDEKSTSHSSNASFRSTYEKFESYNAGFRKKLAERINELSLDSLDRFVFPRDQDTNVTVDDTETVSVNTEVPHIDLPSNLAIPELENTSPQAFGQLSVDDDTYDVQEDVNTASVTADSQVHTLDLDLELDTYTQISEEKNPVSTVARELTKFLDTINSAAKSTFADTQENRQDSTTENLESGVTERTQEKDNRQQEERERGMSLDDESTSGFFHEFAVNFDELVEQVFLMKPTDEFEGDETRDGSEDDVSETGENEFLSHDETLNEMGRQAIFVFTLFNKGILAPVEEEDEEKSEKRTAEDPPLITLTPSDHNFATADCVPGIFASPSRNCETGHCAPSDMFTSVATESLDEGCLFPKSAAMQPGGAYEPSAPAVATATAGYFSIGKRKHLAVPRIDFKVQSRQKPSSAARREDPPVESSRFSHSRIRVLRANLKERRRRVGQR